MSRVCQHHSRFRDGGDHAAAGSLLLDLTDLPLDQRITFGIAVFVTDFLSGHPQLSLMAPLHDHDVDGGDEAEGGKHGNRERDEVGLERSIEAAHGPGQGGRSAAQHTGYGEPGAERHDRKLDQGAESLGQRDGAEQPR